MKILLVNPPNSGRSIPEEKYGLDSMKKIFKGEPLGLEVLAGGLGDHDVRLLDLKVDETGLAAVLDEFRPDLVGFTAVTCEARTALALCREVKERSGAWTAVGGVHATHDPEFFNRPDVDFVFVGLGKLSLRELTAALEAGLSPRGIPGVGLTDPGQPLDLVQRDFTTADLLDDLPPRYDLVASYRPRYVLQSLGLRVGFATSAFGCPFRCTFCSIGRLTGFRHLTCAVAAVARDVALLGDIPVVRLVDANTFADVDHSRKLCRALAELGLGKKYLADARADSATRHPDLFEEWRAAGLKAVVIGFEEVSDARLRGFDKRSTAAVNLEAVRVLHGLGVTIVGDFIVSPDYSPDDFAFLEDFISGSGIDLPMLSILTPLPGTPLFDRMKDRIIIHDLDYYTLTNAVVPTRMREDDFYSRFATLAAGFHANAGL
ncbi:MAG: radical SAM protein [Pseudomonadota bacterium]